MPAYPGYHQSIATCINPFNSGTISRMKKLKNAGKKLRRTANDNPRTLFSEALKAQDRGRAQRAVQLYQKLHRLIPASAEPYINHAELLRTSGKAGAAIDLCTRAIAQAGNHPLLFVTLAYSLRDRNQLNDALEVAERACMLFDDAVSVHFCRGDILLSKKQWDKARQVFEMLQQQEGISSAILQKRALCSIGLSDMHTAQSLLEQAHQIAPNSHEIALSLSHVLVRRGALQRADALLKNLIETHPELPEAWIQYQDSRTWKPTDTAAIAQVQNLAEDPRQKRQNRIGCYFTLGKMYADCNDIPRAFSAYSKANELKWQSTTFCPKSWQKMIDDICQISPSATEAQRKTATGVQPLFIIGMPRSGSTLVEQILATHPQIVTHGEQVWLAECIGSALRYPGDKAMNQPEAVYRSIARCYTRKASFSQYGACRYVVDKMPENYLYLPLIPLLFPGARILHLHREPLDTVFSIYRHNFSSRNCWEDDLKAIAEVLASSRRIVDIFGPPTNTLNLSYEQLVTHPHQQIQQLCVTLGISFHAKMVEQFSQQNRSVMTASARQVRSGISTDSIGSCRPWHAMLGPSITLLKQRGILPVE